MRVYRKARKPFYAVVSLLVLIAELGFTVLAPIAESREPAALGLHVDGPKPPPTEHNPGTCIVCIAMQAPTLPAQPLILLRGIEDKSERTTFELPVERSRPNASAPVARAPPLAA